MGVRAGSITVVYGHRRFVRRRLMSYCFERFESERIWLIDSAQVFDPYSLSRIDAARTRCMLCSIHVSRPFTLYQLRDRVSSIALVGLDSRSTLMISGIDSFQDDVSDKEECLTIMDRMTNTLGRVHDATGCGMVIGVNDHAVTTMMVDRLRAEILTM